MCFTKAFWFQMALANVIVAITCRSQIVAIATVSGSLTGGIRDQYIYIYVYICNNNNNIYNDIYIYIL